LIDEDLLREVRKGQRTTLFVDRDVPEAPGHRVTIASTHLENRAKPKIRRQQMEELLNEERDRANPLNVASHISTTGSDSTPTSVENMLYERHGSMDFRTTGRLFLKDQGRAADALAMEVDSHLDASLDLAFFVDTQHQSARTLRRIAGYAFEERLG
jgi:hypothetical protein